MTGAPWPRLLGLGVFAVALWAQPGALVGAFYDDGVYVTLARALAEGEGYRNIHLPGAPASVHYPPLYPALLSLLWRVWPAFPANVALFALFDAAVLGGAAWLLAAGGARWPLPPLPRYLALALGFTAFPLLLIVGVRFSEPLFLLLLAGAAAAADRERPTVGWCLAAGVLAGLSFLARSVGLAVIGGVSLALWLRGERRGAVIAGVVAAAVALPWFLWTATQAGAIDPRIAANYGTYATEAEQSGLAAIVAGLDLRARGPFVRLTIPILPAWLWYPLAALLLAAAGWGAARLSRAAPALIATTALYTLIISLWPYVPDRFMWVMLPLFAVCLAEGCRAAWARGLVFRGAVVALALVLTVGYARRQVRSLAHRAFTETARDASQPLRLLSGAIAAGTPADAVVATDAEAGMFLYTRRRSVPAALFRWQGRGTEALPRDTVLSYFCDVGVTHVALFRGDHDAKPVVEAFAARSDSAVTPLFAMVRGPALYRVRCPA